MTGAVFLLAPNSLWREGVENIYATAYHAVLTRLAKLLKHLLWLRNACYYCRLAFGSLAEHRPGFTPESHCSVNLLTLPVAR